MTTCISFDIVCKDQEYLIFSISRFSFFFFPSQQDLLCVAMNYCPQNILQTQELPSCVLNILFQRGNIYILSDVGVKGTKTYFAYMLECSLENMPQTSCFTDGFFQFIIVACF